MKTQNDVIVTSYFQSSKILNLKSKDNTRQTLQAEFCASRVKDKRIRGGGGSIRPPGPVSF